MTFDPQVLLFGLAGLSGVVLGRAWAVGLVTFERVRRVIDARMSALNAALLDKVWSTTLAIVWRVALICFTFGMILWPVILPELIGLEHFEESDNVTALGIYVAAVLASVGVSLPRFIRWARQCVRRCPHCGARNEFPHYVGHTRHGYFARVARFDGHDYQCWRCRTSLEFGHQAH